MRTVDLMTTEVWTIRPSDALATAAEAMRKHDCGCLPVINDKHKLVGMVTDRDVCMAALAKGVPLAAETVELVMSKDVVTLRSDDSIEMALDLMRVHQLRRIAVVDDDHRLVGLLSVTDLLREAVRQRHRAMKTVFLDDVALTLSVIASPGGGQVEAA